MILQIEDTTDVLIYLYPNTHFVFLMERSSGHKKQMIDSLHVPNMSRHWIGSQPLMHDPKVYEVFPQQLTLSPNDTQSMVFTKGGPGPFYLPNAKNTSTPS